MECLTTDALARTRTSASPKCARREGAVVSTRVRLAPRMKTAMLCSSASRVIPGHTRLSARISSRAMRTVDPHTSVKHQISAGTRLLRMWRKESGAAYRFIPSLSERFLAGKT